MLLNNLIKKIWDIWEVWIIEPGTRYAVRGTRYEGRGKQNLGMGTGLEKYY